MKFTVKRSDLMAMIAPIMNVIPKKAAQPVLLSLRIEIKGSVVSITGSNNDNTLTCYRDVVNSDNDIVFLVNAEMLFQLISNIPEQPIGFEVQNDIKIVHSAGVLSIPLDGNINTFPIIEIDDKIFQLNIDGILLANAINKVFGIITEDQLRPTMESVFLNFKKGEIASVNFNNVSTYPVDGLIAEQNAMLPKQSAFILKGLPPSANLSISLHKSRIVFKCDKYSLISSLVDGNYANYGAIIDKVMRENANLLKIEKSALTSSIKRLQIVSEMNHTNKQSFVILNLDDNISIVAENTKASTGGSESLCGDYNGEKLSVKIETGGICKHLSNIDESDVEIKFSDHRSPILIQSGLYKGVTMPSN